MSNISKKTADLSPEKLELLLKLRNKKQENLEKKEISPQSRETGLFPLPFAQQRLWFLNQLMPGNPFYNIPFALRLVGSLDVLALSRSLNEIIRRHETLRTCFQTIDAKPTQLIVSTFELTVATIDLQHLPQGKRSDEVCKLASIEASRPFDLTQLPLLRVTLLHLTPTEHVLLFVMHHIISDGWSIGVFNRELTVLYEAFVAGKPSPLPELSIQYADFAVWHRQWLQEQTQIQQLQYWQQQLADITVLQLPTDYPRPAVQSFAGATQILKLPQNLKQVLVKLSQQHEVTLFMTMLAAFKVLLHRYTGQTDIVVGSPIANRNHSSCEGLIGFFVNNLVLRTDVSGNPSFSDLLTKVREVALGAYAHQDFPFEKLVEQLHPERNLSQNPLFQVIFALQNAPIQELQLKGLELSRLELEYNTARVDLEWHIWEHSQGLEVMVAYATDLFAPETIERMVDHFQTLLSGIVANPHQPISQLPLLSEVERQQLLVEWNDTAVKYPTDKCIHSLFEEQVERTPDGVAVVFEDQQLTYEQLNCRANQLAHYLRSLGVSPEVLVGICVERSLDMVVGLLGILKAGGAYLPLDPEYPQDRLSFMLEDAQISLLLTQQRLLDRLPEHQAKLILLDETWSQIAQNNQDNPTSEAKAFHLANVIYTSGSTGRPKGVMVEHKGLCNLAQAQIQTFGLTSDSRILQFASFSFDASIWEVVMALRSGGTLYLGTKDSLLPGKPLIERLRDYSITHITLPPSALAVIPVEELPALQTIIVAGEACPAELIKQWSIGRNFFNAYGPTEATVCATIAKCTGDDEKISIGRAIANTQVYILDSNLQPVPIGVPGELHIGGAGLARGYLNRPELTTEKFIPNPFENSKFKIRLGKFATEGNPPGKFPQNSKLNRLYKTGDLARYLPSGNIEYLGRIDNQVKIRGFRIELGEIEAVLSQHPSVHSVVVTAKVDTPGAQRLVAYIVPQNQSAPTISELRQFMKTKLPNYMVPSAFVMLESLPLTPNGKVDRLTLPAPDTNNLAMQGSFVPPLDIVEQKLAQIWAEVLKVYPVGVKDNFFDLGGHSLLAVQLMARIEQQFKKNLPLATLFQNSTIEQLATILRQPIDALNWSPLVPIQPNGSKRPFFCVPGAGGNTIYLYNLAHHLGKEQPFYGLQSLGLDGESKPHTQIEDIAASYIQAIQSIQPSGPYLLGGHSFGGRVVFEMATQLHERGYEVALLALLDAGGPGYRTDELDIDGIDDAGWMKKIASLVETFYGKSLNVSDEALKVLAPDEQLNYFKQQLQMVDFLAPDVGIKQARGLIQVFKTNFQTGSVYMPQTVYPAQITFFRASEEIDAVSHANSETLKEELGMGWDKFSAQPLDIYLVPGDHVTMMSEPHVQVLAQQLTICIERSEADD
ncbi:amino acid adenylation domain-containing protein [Nostoc sp. UIC 10607]|uniref:MenE n=1 Tax=Nostoc sp. UIC 10607 TaxID=3045935 RepID=A0AA51VKA4_9NOSO|nr:MenE [Nostoc sp. UIC 10607]